MTGRQVLFNEAADDSQNAVLGIDDALEAAEAAYDAAEAEGAPADDEVEVDLEAPAAEDDEEVVEDEDDGEADAEDPDEKDPDEKDPEPPAQLRYADQQEAERAQQEARDALNKAMWERDQALAQARAAQEYQQSHAQQLGTPASLGSAELLTLAQSDPVDAFNQALEAQDSSVVGRIMAEVDVDSKQFAAKAALAAEEGDHEAAQQWQHRAINAATLHRDMLNADQQARWEAQEAKRQEDLDEKLAPIQEERVTTALSNAAHKVMSSEVFEDIDTAKYDAQIGQYIQQYPQIMGNWTPAAMEAGFLVAAQQVVFGGQQQMIEHLVNRKVAAAQGAPPAAKSKARGTGGGAGRRAPAAPATGSAQAQADEIRASVSGSKRPSGMSVLFGG